jgi:hypothetical protein
MYKTIEEAKTGLQAQIAVDLAKTGMATLTTCDQASYGWCLFTHEAMHWLKRHPPTGWLVKSQVKFECTDWTIVLD